ncbi:hypothetical protein AB6C46_07705 [Vibrio sp. 10N.237.312.C02]|uniref:hypothetical protein n=1 Tax=unclassified Vibrio TaxID=2614977 RepID=UPI00352E1EA1
MYTFIVLSGEDNEDWAHVYLPVIPEPNSILLFGGSERHIEKVVLTNMRENMGVKGVNNAGILYLEPLPVDLAVVL